MAIGSIINLGGGGGSLGGKGMIIVDTATMTAGDVIRVRDVYDSSNVQNKTVATVGTPLFFEVAPYCYYKICMVQTISDVETEIGGEYTTIDVGQTVLAKSVNKSTLGGIKGILNAHQENDIMAIGDEVTIKVNNVDVVVQVAEIDLYDSHEITFVAKDIWDTSAFSGAGNYKSYTDSPAYLRTKMQDFYSGMTVEDKALLTLVTKPQLKDNVSNIWSWSTFSDYVFPPNCYEIHASYGTSSPLPLHQFPIFTTQANRIKTYNGNNIRWWSCDGDVNDGWVGRGLGATETGSLLAESKSNTYGVLPCFRLTADS